MRFWFMSTIYVLILLKRFTKPNINSYEIDWRLIFILNKWAYNALAQHDITPDSRYLS